MKNIFYLFIVLFSISNFISANDQIDTLGILSYFPMHVGDQWQYCITNTYYPTDTTYHTIKITGDSLMPNNKYYYEFNSGSFPEYFRVDSTYLMVFTYEPVPPDSEYSVYDLNFVNPDTQLSLYWLFDTSFGQVGSLPYFRKQNLYYWDYYGVFDQTRYLSQYFGLSSKITNEGYGYVEYYNLIGAKIDSIIYGQFVTSVNQSQEVNTFILYQNYPNPFNQTTIIKFSISKIEDVKIEIFNIIGEKLETILNKRLPSGYHQIKFNANKLASGVYYYKIKAGANVKYGKMILMK